MVLVGLSQADFVQRDLRFFLVWWISASCDRICRFQNRLGQSC